ncbi:MAG: zinc-binding dehydrogenase [Armatimonadota bacterium]|nr:zinc-binding dehydrogenase [Armatimonadota bacterium]MDW8155845.1 zinc-binding dehydrogenase [Armatimonadota bacterium]
MRAVRVYHHGGPEVLRVEDVPVPEPGPGQVRVRVRAAAMNHLDLWVRKGIPGVRFPLPLTLGSDGAGVVDAVGPGVKSAQPGDEVVLNPGVSCGVCTACLRGRDNLCREYGLLGEHRDGTDAEFVVVPEANVVRKPANLSFEEAAAFPLVFLTAWNMLVTNARLRPGEDVLVWGAGSGVGSAAIQIAKAFRARVIAVAGDDWKLERARQLGADETVNHRTQDVLQEVRRITGRRGVDVVFEHVGQATWDTSVKALARGGRLVTCGATSGPQVQTDVRYLFGRAVSVHGTWLGSKGELYDLLPLVEAGVLRPVVDRVLPLSEVREAHAYLESGQHFGKVVLVP